MPKGETQKAKLKQLPKEILPKLVADDQGRTVTKDMLVGLDEDGGEVSSPAESKGAISQDGPTQEELMMKPDLIRQEIPKLEKEIAGEGESGVEPSGPSKEESGDKIEDQLKKQEESAQEAQSLQGTGEPKTDEIAETGEPKPEQIAETAVEQPPVQQSQNPESINPSTEEVGPETLPAEESKAPVEAPATSPEGADEAEEVLRQSYARKQEANEQSKMNATWLGKIGYVAKGIGLTIRHGFRSIFSRFGKTKKAWLNPSVDKKTGKKGKSGKQLSWEGVKDYWKTGAKNIAASEEYYNRESMLLGNGNMFGQKVHIGGSPVDGGGVLGLAASGVTTAKNLLTGNFRAFGQSLKETIKAPIGLVSRLVTAGVHAIKNVVTGKVFYRPAESIGSLYNDMLGIVAGSVAEGIRIDVEDLTPEQKAKRKAAQELKAQKEENDPTISGKELLVNEMWHETGTIRDDDTFRFNMRRGIHDSAQDRRGSLMMLLLYPQGSDYSSLSTWWGHVWDDFRKSWLGRLMGLNDKTQQLAIMDADEDRDLHYSQNCEFVKRYLAHDPKVSKEQYKKALKLKRLFETHYTFSREEGEDLDPDSENEDEQFLFDAKSETAEFKLIEALSDSDVERCYKEACDVLKKAEDGDSSVPEEDLKMARRMKLILEKQRKMSSGMV